MKIAIHNPRISYFVGGGEVIPLEHARLLSQMGHEITIITSKIKKESDVFRNFKKENPKINFVFFKLPEKFQNIYQVKPGMDQNRWDIESLNFGRLTLPYYQNNKFDLVAVHYLWDCLGVSPNQKIVLHLHGFPHYKRELDEVAIKIPDKFIAVAKYVKNNWAKVFRIRNIYLCYNGIDTQKFSLPVRNIKKVYDFLYLGRLIPIKGIEILITAFSKLLKKNPKLSLAIGGVGPEEKNLKKMVHKLGLRKNVIFLGKIPEGKKIALYHKSRIFVLLSYDREGVPTTLLEASACGVPIITTNCCGMREFIKNGKNGLLVKPKDPTDAYKKMYSLLQDYKLQEKISKEANREVLANWSWEIRIKELEKIYKLIK